MNIGYAFKRGAELGAMLGAVLGTIGMVANIPALNPLNLSPAVFPLGLAFGTLVGATITGTLYAATHALTYTIPGMRWIMGDSKEPGKKNRYSLAASTPIDQSIADRISIDVATEAHAKDELDMRTVRADHVERLLAEREGSNVTVGNRGK